MNLFRFGTFQLHGGELSNWKIECDALTKDDWECLANLISWKVKFHDVMGVPSGGIPLANALEEYRSKDPNDPFLIVDDVYTTGKSINKFMNTPTDIGFVVFARTRPKNPNIKVLFQYEE